jgi:nitric oxide dioxygenase
MDTMSRFFRRRKDKEKEMSLTKAQTDLIRGSVPLLREQGETIARLFYGDMLTQRPDLKSVFNSANQQNGTQPRALASLVLAFAANVGDLSTLVPRLERVCQKHCSLGIHPDQYDIVGQYLLGAFAQVLGADAWTTELHEAWTKAYTMLSKIFISREAQLYRQFGRWTGWRSLRISQKIAEGDDIYSFHLEPPAGTDKLPHFQPGQYVSVRVNVPSIGHLQSRQYSLSDHPSTQHYRISIKRDRGVHVGGGIEAFQLKPGLVSNLLIEGYNVGDMLEVSHPAGVFAFDAAVSSSTVPLVLISAGSGVTPLMSILNTAVEEERDVTRPISWIQCSAGAAAFEDHVRGLAAARPGLTTYFWQSRAADMDYRNGTARAQGMRLDLERLDPTLLHLEHGSTEYYICGPETFIHDMSKTLITRGVNPNRVRYEWFGTGDKEFKA